MLTDYTGLTLKNTDHTKSNTIHHPANTQANMVTMDVVSKLNLQKDKAYRWMQVEQNHHPPVLLSCHVPKILIKPQLRGLVLSSGEADHFKGSPVV